MSNSNKNLFDKLTTGAPKGRERERKRSVGLLQKRNNELGELVSGKIEDKVHRWVDPARCRIRENHNRRYDLLSERRCQDLIDGFKAQGKQEFAAIVRKLENDANFDYEVICGARRHWTVSWLRSNNYTNFEYLIEVRDLTDEEAFRLSDIENRDKEDISDYERAVDYKLALGEYYKNQKDMAERMEVSEAWLSRYLDLAALPAEVVEAFGDIIEIKVKHGRDLKSHLKDKRTQKKIIERAGELGKEQKQRQAVGQGALTGANVVKELIGSTVTKKPVTRGTLVEYKSKKGMPMMSVSRQGASGLVMRVMPKSGATKTELVKAFEQTLSEYFK
jgi:ParB family chromosome partitioning protein